MGTSLEALGLLEQSDRPFLLVMEAGVLMATFLVDCDGCKAKVAAVQDGFAVRPVYGDENGEPVHGSRLHIGRCPQCNELLAGHSEQLAIEGYDSENDEWGQPIRVFPNPPRVLSRSVPASVRESMDEAEKSIQAGAHIAACVMLGRALEGLCRDQMKAELEEAAAKGKKPVVMLGKALAILESKGIINSKLLEWSKQLQAFRNAAAHAEDESTLTRTDALDLRTFAYAIIEYVYDLTERYNEFMARVNADKAKKAARKTAKK